MEISETVKVISHVGRDRPLKVVPPNVKIIEFAQTEIFWNGPRQGIGIQIEIFCGEVQERRGDFDKGEHVDQ